MEKPTLVRLGAAALIGAISVLIVQKAFAAKFGLGGAIRGLVQRRHRDWLTGAIVVLIIQKVVNTKKNAKSDQGMVPTGAISAASPGSMRQKNAPPRTPTKTRRIDPFDVRPRSDYLNWDDYFMCVAFLTAQRSKDPNKQVGACIVGPEQIILGIGYNGFPRGCSDAKLPWSKKSRDGDELQTKYPYVCHAEMNAVMNKNQSSLVGSKIYVTMFPCNECSKILIQAGIKEVVYYEAKHQHINCKHAGDKDQGTSDPAPKPLPTYDASITLLHLAGVKLRQHIPDRQSVSLDFYDF
jgi:dCMP deaminase